MIKWLKCTKKEIEAVKKSDKVASWEMIPASCLSPRFVPQYFLYVKDWAAKIDRSIFGDYLGSVLSWSKKVSRHESLVLPTLKMQLAIQRYSLFFTHQTKRCTITRRCAHFVAFWLGQEQCWPNHNCICFLSLATRDEIGVEKRSTDNFVATRHSNVWYPSKKASLGVRLSFPEK